MDCSPGIHIEVSKLVSGPSHLLFGSWLITAPYTYQSGNGSEDLTSALLVSISLEFASIVKHAHLKSGLQVFRTLLRIWKPLHIDTVNAFLFFPKGNSSLLLLDFLYQWSFLIYISVFPQFPKVIFRIRTADSRCAFSLFWSNFH